MFRGFHAFSGGGPETLVRNDTSGIVPHLFGGAKPHTLVNKWSPTAGLRELSPGDASKLIKAHLGMRLEPTAFSSWTSDYQTALLSAIEATNGDYKLFDDYPDLSKRHIAILDTDLLGSSTITEVLQVSALHEAKLADTDQPCGFLVYGPVEGTAFRAVPLSDISHLGFNPRDIQVASRWTKELITDHTLRARSVAEKFRHESSKRPDVILTVLAAELSRRRAPRFDLKVLDMFKYRWTDGEVELIVSLLKKDIASMRLDHGGKTALVNRSMYVHHFPQLHLTMKLLEAFMDAAWESRWTLPPQGHLPAYSGAYSTSHGQFRKRPWKSVPGDDNDNARREKKPKTVITETMGHLLIEDMAGPKIVDIEEPPRRASYFIEAGAIAEIVADALKRIAELNLLDMAKGETEQEDHIT